MIFGESDYYWKMDYSYQGTTNFTIDSLFNYDRRYGGNCILPNDNALLLQSSTRRLENGVYFSDLYIKELTKSGQESGSTKIDLGVSVEGAGIKTSKYGDFIALIKRKDYTAYIVTKLDKNKNIVWKKQLRDLLNIEGFDLINHGDDGYILVGNELHSTVNRIILVKLSPTLDVVWERSFTLPDFSRCYDVKTANDGGFVITGSSTNQKTGKMEILLIKTDTEGKVLGNF